MNRKTNIALVNYTNTVPYVKAINRLNKANDNINTIMAIPADCVGQFNRAEVDIALVPVGALADLEDFDLVTNYGIACHGMVRTVKLLSHVPVDEIDQLVLDSDSRTSVELIRLLFKNYWKREVVFIPAKGKSLDQFDDAILAIGDKVIEVESAYEYQYDLGEAWESMTGLPFVFAVWVAKKNVDADVISNLELAFYQVCTELESIRDEQLKIVPWVGNYFTEYIKYKLSPDMKKGMDLFCEMIGNETIQWSNKSLQSAE